MNNILQHQGTVLIYYGLTRLKTTKGSGCGYMTTVRLDSSLQVLPEHPQHVRERDDASDTTVVVLVEHPPTSSYHQRPGGAAHHRLLGRLAVRSRRGEAA